MNKKIEEVLREKHLMIDGNSAYGYINDYEVNVVFTPLDNQMSFKLFISTYLNDNQKRKISETLKAKKIKFFKYDFNAFGLFCGMNGFTANSLAKTLSSTINIVMGCLEENGALKKTHCPVCGKELDEENSVKANVEGLSITMDNECFSKINEEIVQDNKEFEEAPNNFAKGFVGALIGAIGGAILSIILYTLGFISAISAVVSVLLGAFLYKKMGGKPNAMMIVTVLLVSLFAQLAATFFVFVVTAFSKCAESGVVYGVFDAFKYCMADEEFSSAFTHDMILTVVFTVIGLVCEIGQLSQSIKRSKQITK